MKPPSLQLSDIDAMKSEAQTPSTLRLIECNNSATSVKEIEIPTTLMIRLLGRM